MSLTKKLMEAQAQTASPCYACREGSKFLLRQPRPGGMTATVVGSAAPAVAVEPQAAEGKGYETLSLFGNT